MRETAANWVHLGPAHMALCPHGIMEYLVLREYQASIWPLKYCETKDNVINQSLGMLRERDFAMQTLTNKFISDQMLI